ncbi:MAG: ROK family protein [Anaerolineae bacterium]|nr:ROK family protein [Anaerolineae bacterium]
MAKKVLVGVDVGGTSLLAVVTSGKGKILGEKKDKTLAQEGASAVLERIIQAIQSAMADAGVKRNRVRAIGIGMPGPLNPQTGVIYHAPNLGPTWNNTPVVSYVQERLGCPVFLDNDVNVGAVGEHVLGAGRGYQDMVAIFVGTGIGGGVIIGGELYRGHRFTAGEVGHTILLADGPLCGCGRRGCAEALASRTAIDREIQAGLAAGRESLIPGIMAEMGRNTLSSSVLAAALERGDVLMHEVMARAQYYMGLLVANTVNNFDPEAVVLGGGVVERLGASYVDPVREIAEQYYLNQQDKDQVHVVPSELKDYAGVLGAAMLARRMVRLGKAEQAKKAKGRGKKGRGGSKA